MFGFVCKHGSTVIRFVLRFLSTNALEIDIWMLAKACYLSYLMIQSRSHQETGMEIIVPVPI